MIVKLNQLLNMHQHSMKHQMNEFCLQQYFQCLCYCTLKANAENLQFLCLLYLDSFFLSLLCIGISKPHTKTFSPANSCTRFTTTRKVNAPFSPVIHHTALLKGQMLVAGVFTLQDLPFSELTPSPLKGLK